MLRLLDAQQSLRISHSNPKPSKPKIIKRVFILYKDNESCFRVHERLFLHIFFFSN